MSHPVVPITALSINAQKLYGAASSSLTLDRDWLKPGAHQMSQHSFAKSRQLDPEFQPGAELLAAAKELVEHGYAWNMYGNKYGIHRVDQKLFTVAEGDGPWRIKVARVGRPGMRASDEGLLLAVLDGAEIVTRSDNSFGTSIDLKVSVPGARDPEHSSAYAASISVLLPTFPQIHSSQVTFWGIAEAAYLYPIGTNPTLIDDRTHEPLSEPVWCASEYCQGGESGHEPHVIAPYLPPAVDLQRSVLCVEATIRNRKKKRTSK